MSFLLDTNVISHATRPRPDMRAIDWMRQADENEIYLSVITVQEIRQGIELMPVGKRRRALDEWLADQIPTRFEDRLLGINAAIADHCGRLVASCLAAGHTPDLRDALIAATALEHNLTVVTLNTGDFQRLGARMFEFPTN